MLKWWSKLLRRKEMSKHLSRVETCGGIVRGQVQARTDFSGSRELVLQEWVKLAVLDQLLLVKSGNLREADFQVNLRRNFQLLPEVNLLDRGLRVIIADNRVT